MPYLLEDLVVDRVDLVDEGANSAAFITLYKRKEQSDKMDVKEILEKMSPEHATVVQAELDKLNGDVTKAKEDLVTATTERDTAQQDLAKAKEDLKTANDTCTKVQDELDTLKASGEGTSFDEEETMKAMPESARQLFAKMKQQKEAAEETLRKAKESEEQATAVAKAAELKALPIEQDKLIGVLKGASPEMLEVLSTVAAAIDGTVLGEVGKNKPGSATSSSDEAWSKIDKMAQDVAKEKGLSKAKAITQVVNDNPELYKQYLQGGAN